MADRKFNSTDLDILLNLERNEYLKKPADEKYGDFKETDPFPEITASLLNSKDIIQYILTTGMIEPFEPEYLIGATYTCKFSGEYIFWDENRRKHNGEKTGDEPLEIKPNSVMFLGIQPSFNIPDYLVLRFNLRVRNAYKGLLLGTGPIVDPGYIGKLFIPLHNLTSNKYIIKKDALLIDVEFTKLSANPDWEPDDEHKSRLGSPDFGSVGIITRNFSYRGTSTYTKYIEDALTAEQLFTTENIETPFVNSSMQEEIKKIEDMNERTNRKIFETDKKIRELEHFKTLFTLTVITVIFAAVTLVISTGWYFRNAKEIPETQRKITEQQLIIEQQEDDFNKYKSDAQKIINELENRILILEGGEP